MHILYMELYKVLWEMMIEAPFWKTNYYAKHKSNCELPGTVMVLIYGTLGGTTYAISVYHH